MHADSDALLQRLEGWQRHLRALVPDENGDGIVSVRPLLIELLIEDLARTQTHLESCTNLADTVRDSLTEWAGSARALREISSALDRLEHDDR